MAQTTAQRQQAWRQRRAAEAVELRSRVADLEDRLADALAEVERLSAGPRCRHPAEAVDGGTCRACGEDIW